MLTPFRNRRILSFERFQAAQLGWPESRRDAPTSRHPARPWERALMAKTIPAELIGKTFGRLVVVSVERRNGLLYGDCQCECGNRKWINAGSLKKGVTVSCGCRMRECIGDRIRLNTTHGAAARGGTRTFHSWNHMLARCTNPNNPAYADYGGRGISVCVRWLESFANFLADMGECPTGMSIDRFPNNDGNYEPGNCRWATPKQQANNRRLRRDAHLISFYGETKHLTAWAQDSRVKSVGISPSCLESRFFHGWSAERALTEAPSRDTWRHRRPAV